MDTWKGYPDGILFRTLRRRVPSIFSNESHCGMKTLRELCAVTSAAMY